MTVKDLFLNTPISKNIKVQGWVKTFRANRFISLNDGSTFKVFNVSWILKTLIMKF